MQWRKCLGPMLAGVRLMWIGILYGAIVATVPAVRLQSGDAAFFLAEALFCFLAIGNAAVCRSVDGSRIGLWVPVLYCLGGLFVPASSGSHVGQVLLTFVCAVRIWAIKDLALSCSAGVPTFVELREFGPYGLVRHPMDLTSAAARVVYFGCNPCWWNFLVCAFGVVAAVWGVIVEERFLAQQPDWRDYSRDVRYRLLPGVW